ncbi:MAG: GNAT family N-acetyltransferase [Cyanobacteria bacterium J06621_8]
MSLLHIKQVEYQEEKADIRHIRTQVFQLEQNVPAELEFDCWDETTVHLLAYLNGQAVGTTRIREIDPDTAKIERLAVLSEFRRCGVGKRLMETALQTPPASQKLQIIVHAQEYISRLYQQLGFIVVGDKFSEAGIPHVKMIKHQ